MLTKTIFVVALSAIMQSTSVTSYPLSQFYPFGSAAGDSSLPDNDDEYTSSIHISVPFPFFGSTYNSVYVGTRMLVFVKNGHICYNN